MSLPPVVLDLQGAQSIDHRDRGVARYVLEHARAIERAAPGLVSSFVLNPALPPPGGVEDLIATGRLTSSPPDPAPGAIVHLLSPFELSIPHDDLLPPTRRSHRLAVTLYDLIPEVLADRYLIDAGLRRRWRTRAELVRRAGAVLAISRCTARDGIERLRLTPERVTVIGTGTSPNFRPADDPDAARDLARRRLPGLGSRWVLYTGGTDERKNVERLLEAWGLLPTTVRTQWQLVIACSMNELQRNHLLVRADQLGFAGGLLVPGFVPEELLVLLNQAADLAVFPSLYEGYGFPVAEALACGTPAVASNTSSLPELLPDEALFDPLDPTSIAASLDAGLRDQERRDILIAATGRTPDTWDDVAARTLDAYARLATADRPRFSASVHRARRRVAFVSPLPPQPTGVADFSHRLLDELAVAAADTEIDVFVDGPPHLHEEILAGRAPRDLRTRPLAALDRVEALEGPFSEIVVSVGNSEFHTGALAVALRRPTTVIAHDVVLVNLFRFAHWQQPAAVPGGFRAALHAMYGDALPPDIAEEDRIDPEIAARWGVVMARGLIARSRAYLVTSQFAADWARLDACAADADKIDVLPFPVGAAGAASARPGEPDRSGPPIVASFGLVNDAKDPLALVHAVAAMGDGSTRLAFVGRAATEQADQIRRAARGLGVADRVELTGEVDATQYSAWLKKAWVAVQLRTHSNGEASAAVGDCLAAGVPTVVSDLGSSRDLPDGAVVKLATPTVPAALASTLDALVGNPTRRRDLSVAALAYAADHTFAGTARALLAAIGSPTET